MSLRVMIWRKRCRISLKHASLFPLYSMNPSSHLQREDISEWSMDKGIKGTDKLTLLPFCWSLSWTGRCRLSVQQTQHMSGTRLAVQWSIHRRSLWGETHCSQDSVPTTSDNENWQTQNITYKLWQRKLLLTESANTTQLVTTSC